MANFIFSKYLYNEKIYTRMRTNLNNPDYMKLIIDNANLKG
jgi:hypothetical protein